MDRFFKCNRTVVAACVVLLTALVIAPSNGVWTAGVLEAPVIGTVDLERVFNDIDRRNQAEGDLEEKILPYQTRAEELKLEATRLRDDLEMLAPGTQKYEQAQKQLTQVALDYAAMVEFIQLKLDATRAAARRDLFTQIIDATASYAQANGIDFIITNDSTLPIQEGTDLQIVQQLAMRRVVYANDAYDVTGGLIDWMNGP